MNARRASACLVALALLGVLACAVVALRQPASGGDYVTIWGMKARALERTASPALLARPDPAGLAAHPEYPILWPALLALFSAPLGRYDDLFVTLLWPLLCAAAAFLAARATRAPAPAPALAAAVVALLPYWRVWVYVGYAEALLAVLLLGALGAAGAERHETLLFVLLLLAALTKQEGAAAAAAIALVLLAARRYAAGALAAAAGVLGTVPWNLFVASRTPVAPARDFSHEEFAPEDVLEAAEAFAVNAGVPGLAWIAGGALLLFLAPLARRRNRGVLAAAGLYALALLVSFGFSVRNVGWHVRWTWDRLAFVVVVLLVPVLAEAASEAARGSEALSEERPLAA